MTTRKPWSASAQTACSRDDPVPKFGPATRTVAPAYSGRYEDEVRILSPGREECVLETVPGDALEIHGRDDLVGVDVAATQRQGCPRVRGERFHDSLRLS